MNVLTVHIPFLAFLALAALFGHDALMTAGPHDTGPAAHHAHVAPEHGATSHDAPEPTCHLSEGARPAPATVADPLPSGAGAMPVTVDDLCRSNNLPSWQAPPVTPPDVARALLQVFLN